MGIAEKWKTIGLRMAWAIAQSSRTFVRKQDAKPASRANIEKPFACSTWGILEDLFIGGGGWVKEILGELVVAQTLEQQITISRGSQHMALLLCCVTEAVL